MKYSWKNGLLFSILIVSAKPWQSCETETSADDLLLGLHQKHTSLPANHWLVHYYTALSTGIRIAAPKHLLVSHYIHAFHSWLAADEVCALLLRGFELDQLSQNVLLPSRNHSINPVRSYLQCLCAHSTDVPGEGLQTRQFTSNIFPY